MTAAAVSAAATTTAASPQTAPIAWDVALAFPGAESVRPVDALATPDGGVVVLATSFSDALLGNAGGPATAHAVALSANGDERWRWSGDLVGGNTAAFGSRYMLAGTVDGDGALQVTWSYGATSQLAKIGPDGDVVFERALDDGAPELADWEACGIDRTPDGDLRVGGTFRNFFLAYESHFTRVDSIAPDGTFNWQYASIPIALLANELIIDSSGTTYLLGTRETSGVFGGTWSAGVTVLTAQGFYAGFAPGLSQNSTFQRAALSDDGGVACLGASFAADRAEVLVLDGAVTRWSTMLPAALGHGFDIGMTSAGEVLVATGDSTVTRYDSVGSALPGFVFPDGTPGAMGAYALSVRDDDSVLVHGGDLDRVATTLFDPVGNVVWTTIRPGDGTVPPNGRGQGLELDVVVGAFGNVFTTYRATVDGPSGPVLSVGVQKLLDGASVGQTYCDPAVTNSTGVPGRIQAFGSDARADNNLSLVSSQLPPGSFGLLLASRTEASTPLPAPSVGILCIGGTIGRYLGPGEVRPSTPDGRIVLRADLGAIPEGGAFVSGTAGETWHFQTWYRDVVGGAQTPNATDGARVLLR
ncbi:MAG: hypothetical protein AAFU73_16755 [Planctomycetota bacterium]